jgi:hypothetical protein
MVKFIYSEKATEFEDISQFYLTLFSIISELLWPSQNIKTLMNPKELGLQSRRWYFF